MIVHALLTACLVQAADPWGIPRELRDPAPAFQEETGIPIYPFSGIEGGFISATFPDEWGLETGAGKWLGTAIVGGEWENLQFFGRFKIAQWASVDVEETQDVPLPDGFVARIRAMMVEGSIDWGFGFVRVGGTVGGGSLLIKNSFEDDHALILDIGPYVRIQPLPWFVVEGGVLANWVRTDFNQDSPHWDFMPTYHASAGLQLRF